MPIDVDAVPLDKRIERVTLSPTLQDGRQAFRKTTVWNAGRRPVLALWRDQQNRRNPSAYRSSSTMERELWLNKEPRARHILVIIPAFTDGCGR